MKKTYFVLPALMLILATSCGTRTVVNPSPQVPDPGKSNPSSLNSSDYFPQHLQQPASPASRVYDSPYFKVTVPAGWSATEAYQTIYVNGVPKRALNLGALNISKNNYILYINAQASQASGVRGGRFNEIAGGAPSADAVILDPSPGVECSSDQVSSPVTTGHPRIDLYVGPKDKAESCHIPDNGKSAWFFSYIADETYGGRGFFNYYNQGQGPTGYVVTMAYNSKDVNKLPVKGSPALNAALKEMTDIVKTLEIKQK